MSESCKNCKQNQIGSEVFSCIDIIDDIDMFFILLQMCQEILDDSSENSVRSRLLIDSFFLNSKPSIDKLRKKLLLIYLTVK